MGIPTWTIAAAIGVGALVHGCTQTEAGTAQGATTSADGGASDGSSASASSVDGGTSASGLSCTEVLQCGGECPDGDGGEPCVRACGDRASTSSKPVTTAFIDCLASNACLDADCINTKCGTELDACLADTPTQGTPSTGQPVTGSVPATLVGTWSSVGLSTGTAWTFEADGTTTSALEIDSSLGSCTYKTSVTTSGVTVASADTLVYHRASGTQVLKKCASTSSSTLGAADLTYRYAFGTFDDGQTKLTLYLVNADGTVSTSGTDLHR